jgi:NAD(P)-dependent dehydrogenase (short-subunit alcohol dehydrogenase family)
MEKSAFITGGSTGIGLEIARELGRRGFALTVVSRRRERIDAASEKLREEGFEAIGLACDLRDAAGVESVFARHANLHGSLDALVNDAGMGVIGPIEELSVEAIDRQLAVNLRAALLAYRAAVPLLRAAAAARGGALVVNLASISAARPQPDLPVYAATKAGLIGLTNAMNRDLSAEGIRSTALCPGLVDTEMTTYLRDSIAQEDMIPARDLAAAVGWLTTTAPSTVVPEIPFLRRGGIE